MSLTQKVILAMLSSLLAFALVLFSFLFFRNNTTQKEDVYTLENQDQSIVLNSEIKGVSITTSESSLNELKSSLNNYNVWDLNLTNTRREETSIQTFKVIITDRKIEGFEQYGTEKLSSMSIENDPSSSSLIVTIQLTPFTINNFTNEELELHISERIFESIYISSQNDGISINDNTEAKSNVIDAVNDFIRSEKKFVKVSKGLSNSLFIKEANASHCSGYTYDTGSYQSTKTCSGGLTDGDACNSSTECQPGGSCVVSGSECVFTGTGQCVDAFDATGGHGCAPGNLGNCTNEDCSTVAYVGPPLICNNNGTCEPARGETSANCSDCSSGPSGPVCGNGSCESGEDATNCSSDCPIVGSCSGGNNPECFTGANCGVIGKVPGSGSCSGGALCCVNGVGGSSARCDIGILKPDLSGLLGGTTINVGQTISLPVRHRVYNSRTDWDNCPGIWPTGDNVNPIVTGNDTIASVTPGYFCSIPGGDYQMVRYISVTGQSVGSTPLSVTGFAQGDFGSGQCYNSAVINVINTPLPSCTVQIVPSTDPTSIAAGEQQVFSSVVSCINNTSEVRTWNIRDVDGTFHSQFIDGFGILTGQGPQTGNSVNIFGESAGGEDQIEISVLATGPGGTATFTDTVNYEIGAPGPWAQILGGGDVIVGSPTNQTAGISINIPITCVGGCANEMILADTDGVTETEPGLVVSPGTTSYSTGSANNNDGTGDDWHARTYYSGENYDFAAFDNLISGKNVRDVGASTIKDAIDAAPVNSDGYKYVRAGSDAFMGSGAVPIMTQKVVVLVNGDVTFGNNTRVRVSEDSGGFFMLVASGDITVNETVRTSGSKLDSVLTGSEPALEGVYYAGGIFSTGTTGSSDDYEFSLRGMVVAMNGFNLQRDRGDNNTTLPGEVFEYAPDYSLYFPTSLSEKHLYTREIIP